MSAVHSMLCFLSLILVVSVDAAHQNVNINAAAARRVIVDTWLEEAAPSTTAIAAAPWIAEDHQASRNNGEIDLGPLARAASDLNMTLVVDHVGEYLVNITVGAIRSACRDASMALIESCAADNKYDGAAPAASLFSSFFPARRNEWLKAKELLAIRRSALAHSLYAHLILHTLVETTQPETDARQRILALLSAHSDQRFLDGGGSRGENENHIISKNEKVEEVVGSRRRRRVHGLHPFREALPFSRPLLGKFFGTFRPELRCRWPRNTCFVHPNTSLQHSPMESKNQSKNQSTPAKSARFASSCGYVCIMSPYHSRRTRYVAIWPEEAASPSNENQTSSSIRWRVGKTAKPRSDSQFLSLHATTPDGMPIGLVLQAAAQEVEQQDAKTRTRLPPSSEREHDEQQQDEATASQQQKKTVQASTVMMMDIEAQTSKDDPVLLLRRKRDVSGGGVPSIQSILASALIAASGGQLKPNTIEDDEKKLKFKTANQTHSGDPPRGFHVVDGKLRMTPSEALDQLTALHSSIHFDHQAQHGEEVEARTSSPLLQLPDMVLLTVHQVGDIGGITAWTALGCHAVQMKLYAMGYVLVYKVHEERHWATMTYLHITRRDSLDH